MITIVRKILISNLDSEGKIHYLAETQPKVHRKLNLSISKEYLLCCLHKQSMKKLRHNQLIKHLN